MSERGEGAINGGARDAHFRDEARARARSELPRGLARRKRVDFPNPSRPLAAPPPNHDMA